MHIALYSPAWPPSKHPNGIVTYVHWMREELRRLGHRVSVFCSLLSELEADVYLVRAPVGFRARMWLAARKGDSRYLVRNWGVACAASMDSVHKKHPIDVIEMEESFGWCGDVARLMSMPVVVKLHGPAFLSLVEEELHTTQATERIEAEGAALSRIRFLISPSRSTLQQTIERYALTPVLARHISNPLELPPGAPVWRLGDCDCSMLLFVGRFDKRKGADVVLEAFARLVSRRPHLKLFFVGPDSGIRGDGGEVMHFADFGARLFADEQGRQVTFLGQRAATDIYALRARALVTIAASRWENQSYATLEAMLQGCPIVSSDAGGQSEIISADRTGLLAPAGDAAALAAKVELLIDNPQRAADLGRSAREFALSHHSPSEVARRTIAMYREAIDRSSRKPALAGARASGTLH